jgi:hypothetical protein
MKLSKDKESFLKSYISKLCGDLFIYNNFEIREYIKYAVSGHSYGHTSPDYYFYVKVRVNWGEFEKLYDEYPFHINGKSRAQFDLSMRYGNQIELCLKMFALNNKYKVNFIIENDPPKIKPKVDLKFM